MGDRIDNSSLRLAGWIRFLIIITGIILAASSLSVLKLRLDLTEDKRYTLSDPQ